MKSPETSQRNPHARRVSEFVKKQALHREAIWRRKGPLLSQLDMELTERCDSDCIHCSINLPENNLQVKKDELNTIQWKKILDQAAKQGVLTVRFTGGEPLLREDFAELYLYTRRLGIRVLLFTNARHITPELAALFVKIPPLEKIEVTVYGMRQKSYEAVSRKQGSFTEFCRGIDLLLKNNIPFIVKGALLPANKTEIGEFESWAATIPWMDRPPSYSMTFDLRGRRDSNKKNQVIRTLRATPGEVIRMLDNHRESYRNEMAQFCQKFIGPPGKNLFVCGAGRGGCVDAYGRLQPCLSLRAPELNYDLKNGTLHDALIRVFPELKKIVATNPDYLKRCARCFLKGLCEQCPAKSWAENGTLDTPVDYLCEIAHAQARNLGILADGERGWEVNNWHDRITRLK